MREKLRQQIKEYVLNEQARRKPAEVGTEYIGYAGAVYDDKEIWAMVDSLLDGWFGLGKRGRQLSEKLTQLIGSRGTVLVNSGSSANLAAVAALCSPTCDRPLRPGDEVITPACTFPTTLNPLLQHGLIPVFVDVEIGTYNMDLAAVEKAITAKTKLIMFPHTMGNPNDMDRIMELARSHNLYVIEDNCDALGSLWDGKPTGSFGDLSTLSFYPAHHITMGEGGAVLVNRSGELLRTVHSMVSWGRDCFCDTDERHPQGACRNRHGYEVNGIPYDHKYIYSQIGYNLKPTEVQAAMGVEQMDKLPGFIAARRKNFQTLWQELKSCEDFLILPKWHEKAEPSWFSFVLTLRDGVPFQRKDLIEWLEDQKIQTRLLFAGNIIHQPAYQTIEKIVTGDLKNSDKVMRDTFFVGVYPGLGDREIAYIVEKIKQFLKRY